MAVVMIMLLPPLNSKHSFKLIAHPRLPLAVRLLYSIKLLSIHLILVLPLQDRLEIHALPVNTEVRERMFLALHPIESDHIQVGIAHQALQQHVDAVIRMHAMEFAGDAIGVFLTKVVGEVDVPAKCTETVDLMEDVQFGYVGIGTETEVVGVFGYDGGIFAEGEDVGACDGGGVEATEVVPCSVDLGRGRLAVNGIVSVEEGAVDFSGVVGEGNPVVHRCWERRISCCRGYLTRGLNMGCKYSRKMFFCTGHCRRCPGAW